MVHWNSPALITRLWVMIKKINTWRMLLLKVLRDLVRCPYIRMNQEERLTSSVQSETKLGWQKRQPRKGNVKPASWNNAIHALQDFKRMK